MPRSTLPSSYEEKEHALDLFLSKRFSLCREHTDKVKDALNPKKRDSTFLNHLALKKSVDFWDDLLTEEDKRSLLSIAIQTKRHKGTIGGLKLAFESLGLGTNVHEWFEYGGDAFHFKLDLAAKDREITEDLYKIVAFYTHEYKNTRSVLDETVLSYLEVKQAYVSIGSAGETESTANMISGYVLEQRQVQKIHSAGIGEVTAYTQMEVS